MATANPQRHAGGRPRSRALCAEGLIIEAAANERGMTRQDIADQTGITYVSVMRILVGDAQPSLGTAKKMAQAVGLQVGDIWK